MVIAPTMPVVGVVMGPRSVMSGVMPVVHTAVVMSERVISPPVVVSAMPGVMRVRAVGMCVAAMSVSAMSVRSMATVSMPAVSPLAKDGVLIGPGQGDDRCQSE
jgi:hypothetical protein